MFVLSNKISSGMGAYHAFRNMQVYLFKGERPKNESELSFDPYSATECLKNSVAHTQFLATAINHLGNAASIPFTRSSFTSGYGSIYKLNFVTESLNAAIPGHNIPVVRTSIGTKMEDGTFKEHPPSNVRFEANLNYSANMTKSSTSSADRNSYFWYSYQTPIVYDFGKIREVDGLINAHYYLNGQLPYTRYMYVEYWDDTNSVWVEWAPGTLWGGSNVDARASGPGYTASTNGAFPHSYTNQYQVEFDVPIVTSKIRVTYREAEKPVEAIVSETRGVQFFTKADVSAELAEEHEVTWALFCPALGGENIHTQRTNEFLAVKVGKTGVDDPNDHPLMLAETKFGPLTGNTFPAVSQCKLDIGLL